MIRRLAAHSLAALLAGLVLISATASAQQKRVYLAADDKSDLFWTADEATYLQAFVDTIDYYLDRADATIAAGEPSAFQSRWNCDGSLWMWTYERRKSAADFQRLIGRIKSGHISVPLNGLCVSHGAAPAELVLRGMYYPGRIERAHDLRFRLVYMIENQTEPLGVASLWAGSGARWSWNGICDCDTQVPQAGNREHDIYRWVGLDGQGVLMKWNTLLSATTHIANQSMGGYSEARFPLEVVEIVTTQAAGNGFAARYPYNVIGAFGQGWDDVQTMNQVIVDAAKAKTNASRQVIVSNEEDFFQDFEATYPLASLPVKSVSYGNEWELYCASLAETSARVKRATEKLRPAEALAAIESQLDPTFMNGREADRDLAFMDLGLYLEHDFGMAGAPGGQPTIDARVQWQKRLAGEIDAYVDDLHADGVTALGRRIPGAGGATRFFAFNPLGWQRSAPADFAYAGPTPFHVVDVATQTEVRSQLVTAGGPARIRILAENVPSLGYRVYEVRQGAGTSFPPAASVNGGQMLSARYSLTVAGDGAITSLVDRAQNGRQFAEQIGGLWLNDPGTGGGTLTVEDAGPVSVTLRADSSQPLQHSTRVTLYTGVQRVDIENRITQNFSSDQTWSFGFKLTSPRVRHEEVGAILEARLDSQGGHYSSRNARYDWLTLNHFADISGNDGAGVTLSNADCYFFKLGNSTVGTLDSSTPRLTVLAGGRPNFGNGLPNQGGDTLFVQRFALQTHVGYDATQAMRMALEHQNPLVCGDVTSSASALPADVFSALSISDPDVLLWAFKPAEEGVQAGLIARAWNVSNQPQAADLQLAPTPIVGARRTTHIETDEETLTVGASGLSASFGPQQMRTFRLLLQ